MYAVGDDCESEVSWLGELLRDETGGTGQAGILHHIWGMPSVG